MKTHYDLGYTHPVDEMLRSNADWMLDKVMAFCDGTRGNPPGSRFIWNYPSWLVGKLRELLGEEKRRRLEEYIRRGEISWSGLPFTLHSYFCGLEDIVRSVYFSAALDREFGTAVRWAKQTDVPGHTRILPQVLAKSGIRFRYRFRPHTGGFVEGGAPRFGWETAQPLVPVLVAILVAILVAVVPPGAPQAPAPSAARRSFILAEGGTTVLLNLKRAEDGKGIIARLFETCGKADEVRISLPGRTIRSASKSLATELPSPGEGAGRLEIRDGAATVPVGPWSIETVRLEL
jgi:hypothetical protein